MLANTKYEINLILKMLNQILILILKLNKLKMKKKTFLSIDWLKSKLEQSLVSEL